MDRLRSIVLALMKVWQAHKVRLMKATILWAVLFGLGFSTSVGLTQNLVNGSFELPGGLSENGVIGLPPGDTRLTGWTIGGTGVGVSYLRGAGAGPADGEYHLDFNGGNTAAGTSIKQTFNTTVGATYTLGFAVARLGSAFGEMSITAKVKSSTGVQLALLKALATKQTYQEHELTFTATTSTTTVGFVDTSLATIAVDILLDDVTLTQKPGPIIVRHPQSQNIHAGSSLILNVAAKGTGPLAYQWRFNQAPIAGATTDSLRILNFRNQHAGNYDVVVSDIYDSVTSALATLTVSVTGTDLNGDGKSDIVWQNNAGLVAVWWMNGTNVLGSAVLGELPARDWRVVCQADLDQDGISDVFTQSDHGQIMVWLMAKGKVRQTVLLWNGERLSSGWTVVGGADFNHDGSIDILMQNVDGSLVAWFMTGTNYVSGEFLRNGYKPMPGWKVVGLIDFDQNGQKDLLWQSGQATLAVWIMDGIELQSTISLNGGKPLTEGFGVVGVADFNHDEETDLLLQHINGSVQVWFMDGANRNGKSRLSRNPAPGSGWKVVGPK